ncbi:MAG TPA: amino acid permease [Caulobacteraceae bacterium]
MAFWNRTRPIDGDLAETEVGEVHGGDLGSHRLRATLSWPHLLALGVGAIVGTGIFTLIGIGADKAGPAVMLSFLIVGVVCACAALAYAEMATLIPRAGSAYTYSYAVLGELIAWIVGWSLILEYSLVVSAVAVGWSGYFVGFWNSLADSGTLPALSSQLTQGPHVAGGLINLPAVLIIAVVAGVLLLGTRESATINALLVGVKLVALAVFVFIAAPAFDAANMTPFMPKGFGQPLQAVGVMGAAAIIFFAFYGFDAISTAAEETRNPGRDLPIGIVGSMIVCTLIYIAVAACAVGAVPYTVFANSPEPLALILRGLGEEGAARWIAGAAVVAFPTVLLAFLYGQTRIFYGMARDGLLPGVLARIGRRGVPVLVTVVTAVVVAVIAGFARLDEIAALANAGTLAAFVAVAVCMLVLRVKEPDRPRVFRAPLAWVIGPVAILGCLYLFLSLGDETRKYFFMWNGLGLVVYLLWAARNSRLAKQGAA